MLVNWLFSSKFTETRLEFAQNAEGPVKSGDSFYSIAKNYSGVSAQEIMDFNGISSSNIKPGMTIRIPQK